jgi:hypothetical protein
MLVPLTDSTNPYAALMLTLIQEGRVHPHSRWPRQTPKRGLRARARRLVTAVRTVGRGRPASAPSAA